MSEPPAMRHIILWSLLVAVMLGVGAAYLLQRTRRPADVPPPAPPVFGVVKPFTLTERSGHDVGLKDLEGSIWIADFIYTFCNGPCPRMSDEMAKLQKELPKDVRFVSFSVDPVRDTPETLREYADKYGAEGGRWRFLTGGREALWAIAHDSFMLSVVESSTPNTPVHDEHFCLVDRRGRVRGFYLHYDVEAMSRLRADVAALRREP